MVASFGPAPKHHQNVSPKFLEQFLEIFKDFLTQFYGNLDIALVKEFHLCTNKLVFPERSKLWSPPQKFSRPLLFLPFNIASLEKPH